eukprot:490012-Prorocentrum_minimum.AAC.1
MVAAAVLASAVACAAGLLIWKQRRHYTSEKRRGYLLHAGRRIVDASPSRASPLRSPMRSRITPMSSPITPMSSFRTQSEEAGPARAGDLPPGSLSAQWTITKL